jgi:3-isopropylmalate dehydrogenase
MNVAVLPGDGIGPEIIAQARKVLLHLELGLDLKEAPVGGAAYETSGDPLPPATL